MPDQPATKHISFEDGNDGNDGHDGHSSASDEDRNAVEVVFDPSNPYRRKSSLVSSEAVPPRLRRSLAPADKAQCIVHHLIEAQRSGGAGASGGSSHLHHDHEHAGGKHHLPLPHLHKHPHRAHHHDEEDDGQDGEDGEDGDHQRKETENGGVHRSIDVSQSTAARTSSPAVSTADQGWHRDGVFDASAERGLDRFVEPKGSNNSSRDASQIQLSTQRPRRHTIVEPSTSDSEAGQVDEQEWTTGITTMPTDAVDATDVTDDNTDREQQPKHPEKLDQLKTMKQRQQQLEEPPELHLRDGPLDRTMSELSEKSEKAEKAENSDVLHSRLLTKKQLSEMAWGVRELSRRLGSLRLRFRVKTIFLLTKIYDEDLLPKTRALTRWLLSPERDVRYTVYLERSLRTNKLFDVPGLLSEVHQSYVAAGQEQGAGTDNNGPDDLAKRLRFWDEGMCRTRPHTFDFVITLGGDGTVLYASWLFQRIVPPVLSFSLGSLGFLTKFDFEDYQSTLTRAFTQGVTVGLRLRFEATIMRSSSGGGGRSSSANMTPNGKEGDSKSSGGHRPSPPGEPKLDGEAEVEAGAEDEAKSEAEAEAEAEAKAEQLRQHRRRDLVEELIGEEMDDEHTHRPDGTYEILNEVVIDRGPNPTMSYTEIFGDDEHFTSVLADGICVSTPTGSTAYNLAAGGSLCHPENPVMLVTSICAHTLSFRPIILPDTIVLRVGVPYDARTSSWASFDGRERLELNPGDYVTISASRFPFASVQAPGRRSEDWVNSISGKLGWNTRQKQKAYKEWDK